MQKGTSSVCCLLFSSVSCVYDACQTRCLHVVVVVLCLECGACMCSLLSGVQNDLSHANVRHACPVGTHLSRHAHTLTLTLIHIHMHMGINTFTEARCAGDASAARK